MDCEHAPLALPWLRNGSLDGTELESVTQHLRECAGCRAALAEVDEAWETYGAHLPPEALTAYVEDGDWAGIPRTEIAAHLDLCPSCQLEVALLREAEPDPGERPVSGTIAAPLPMRATLAQLPRRHSGTMLPLRLAATLALVAGGWGLWSANRTVRLGEELARLGAPRVEPPAVELAPDPHAQRGGATPAPASVALGEAGLRLVVSTDDTTEYAAHRLEMVDSRGRIVWTDDEVHLDARRELALVLSRNGTPAGRYELRLLGRSDGVWVAIDSYTFELTVPAPARSIAEP